jgi:hypothetical protein
MAEIIRVGGWGLRGLGFSFGVAERAVHLLAWTEAALGGGMRSIRLAEERIVESYAAPKLSHIVHKDGLRELQAHGRHLLEIGPPAVDLVTADARKSGKSRLSLFGSIGPEFVPALASILAHRKLSGIVVYGAGADTEPHAEWLHFGPGVVSVPRSIDREVSTAELSSAGYVSVPDRQWLGDEWAKHVQHLKKVSNSYLGFIVWKGTGGYAENSDGNLSARVSAAWTQGIETPLEDIRYLYELEMRAWAPTSERSRSQAGYGKF